jgi:sugar/nucleoside kinase (ribokinase family)
MRAPPPPGHFDVVCAGEARWDLRAPHASQQPSSRAAHLRPGGGAVSAALALARRGLRVGLATAFGDDTLGRTLLERVAAAGVDVGGVELTPPAQGLVFVEGVGASRQVLSFRETETPVAVPAAWSSQVLLLSGLSPVVSYAAALCKAARAARRAGTVVMVDVNARRHAWAGRDPRAIFMLLREADIVRSSAGDCASLGVELDALRASLRPGAVLVASNRAGDAWAAGPFGEVARPRPKEAALSAGTGAGDAFTAAVCAEIARAGHAGHGHVELWDRALTRAQAAAGERARASS